MVRIVIFFAVLASPLCLARPSAAQGPLRILAWNLESGGNDATVIARELADLSDYDILALSELNHNNLKTYAQAVRESSGRRFVGFHSVSGGHDRLGYLFDKQRLQLLNYWELMAYNGEIMNDGRHRSPLMAHFRERQSNREFLINVNHLARGNAKLRRSQARSLRLWAQRQRLPLIAIGDFNFDYDFPTQRGNKSFEEFMSDDTWQWIVPNPLIDTNWSDPDGDGRDNYPDSCLDFAFVAGIAKQWKCVSRVIVRDGDFPDNEQTSDHRPIELVVEW